MNRIFGTSQEKFLKSVVLYPNGENVLCYDAAFAKKVPAADLKNLYFKNLIVVDTTSGAHRPCTFQDKTTYYAVVAHTVSMVTPWNAGSWSALTVTAFSDASTYSKDDYVTHESKLYQAKANIGTAGDWDADDWTEVPFTVFSTDNQTYNVGDVVLKSDTYYKCTTKVEPSETITTLTYKSDTISE